MRTSIRFFLYLIVAILLSACKLHLRETQVITPVDSKLENPEEDYSGEEKSILKTAFVQCDGTIGSFDVYTLQSKTDSDQYELVLMSYEVADPGSLVTITAANSTTGEFKTLINWIPLEQDDEISAGYLSATELNKYDVIAVTPYDPTTNFGNQVSDKEAICDLPIDF